MTDSRPRDPWHTALASVHPSFLPPVRLRGLAR
jgi:hypothetical protein